MDKDIHKVFTIGQLAQAAGVNPQTLRFYERKGILKPTNRLQSKYRMYNLDSLKRLRFIRQAKSMGFSLDEIQGLLSLRIRTIGRCDQVRSKAAEKLSEVRDKIKQLKKLESTLNQLISDCEKRFVTDECPILTRMES